MVLMAIILTAMVLIAMIREEALCSEGKSLMSALDEGADYQGKGAVFYQVMIWLML